MVLQKIFNKKRTLSVILLSVILLLVGVSVFYVTHKPTKPRSNANLDIILQSSGLTWDDIQIKETNVVKKSDPKGTPVRVYIDMHYPKFKGGKMSEKLNAYIDSTVKKIISDDELKSAGLGPNEVLDTPVDIKSSYTVTGINYGVVSIDFTVTDFTGGGNGNHDYPITINWDLKSNRLLDNSELFCSKDPVVTIAPLVRKQLMLEFFDPGEGSDAVRSTINNGTENTPDNWRYFLLTNDGLLVLFPPYQVSDGGAGVVSETIPYSDIPNLICLP